MCCKFLEFCSGALEDSSLQGYGALSVGDWYQTYQHSMGGLILKGQVMESFTGCLTLQDEGTALT